MHINVNDQTISVTIRDGHSRVVINAASFQIALRLPQLDHYSEILYEEKCKSLQPKLEYNFSPQGTIRDPTKYTLHQCYCADWKYLTRVIGKCLGHKTSSLDQVNRLEQRIVYDMACNKILDFTQLFFD